MNHFAIERNGECWDDVILVDENNEPILTEFLAMTYDEMKNSDKLSDFITATMAATNNTSNTIDDQTSITLVGEDGVFIWGIIMDSDESDNIRYNIVDWKKDGKKYRYAP